MSIQADRPRRRVTGDRAMRRATLVALVVGLALDAFLIAFAAVSYDRPAVLGALVGTALTLVVVVPSVTIAFVGQRMTPVTMAVTVLASWAGKMLVVILVLLLVQGLETVSNLWIGQALLVGALSAVVVEVVLLARSRQPLETNPSGGASESPEGA